ncbi:MAG TPA: hypothetical protein VMZ69_08490 [Saprospiraceae bacterium]|nr:hypothetical protein [Saprospiraceae bacterium]
MQHVIECKQIGRDKEGVISFPGPNGETVFLSKDTPVSMNMWGFYPSYFTFFEIQFNAFLSEQGKDIKSEFYIPTLVDELIKNNERKTKVLHSEAEWFGVTYIDDKEYVSQRLKFLIEDGVYPYNLWE